MSRVEVLAPLRIETRFVADEAGGAGWTLRLRVYPDDVLLARPQPPATAEELDVLEDALRSAAELADPAAAAEHAYRAAASALGARRAWWLWREDTVADPGAAGARRRVDRGAAGARAALPATPAGLPERLTVWLRFTDGRRRAAATLVLDGDGIRADLEVDRLDTGDGTLPRVWWLDLDRAESVGLAAAIPLSASEAESIETLVVVGTGAAEAAGLLAAHSASGRLGVLPQGTATNTIAGAPTAPSADDAGTWLALLDAGADAQADASALLRAFGVPGAELPGRLPIPGGGDEHTGLGRIAVEGLWPVLWGRSLRDVVGTLGVEPMLARWAAEHLAVQGPLPAIRVGEQPYGLLPTSAFERWRDDPADDPVAAGIEARVLAWTLPWRAGAAAAARGAAPVPGASPSVGVGPEGLLALQGRHAPSTHWRVRPAQELAALQAAQIQQGLPVAFLTEADRGAARAWHGSPVPIGAIGAAGSRRTVPGPPRDAEDDPELLREMIREEPRALYGNSERRFGLVGRLLRESMIIARATVGIAWSEVDAGLPVDPARRIPLDDRFHLVVALGTDAHVEDVRAAGDEGLLVAERFDAVQRALDGLVDRYEGDRDRLLRAVKAALDAASFRVDPWLTGVAGRRLERLAADGTPFLVGAYGWVDAPRPWRPGDPESLAPGPTSAGLLHAPSYAQAQVAAVLRDAALRPGADRRWDLALHAGLVRDAVELSERVRLGVHPMEALGLQVEAIAGDPDTVRTLRKAFPTTPEDPGVAGTVPNDPVRRVCDGLAVLDAARDGALPATVPADLAARLAPLDEVLDGYADLLLVDGVHSLMTRSPEAGGAAMEAAAGLGSPPGLWGVRTPRAATTVSVSCWVVLPPGPAPAADADPVEIADPAFAALLPADALADPGHPELVRAATLLGDGSAPGPTGGDDPDGAHLAALAEAMTADLAGRWTRLGARLAADRARVADAADPIGPDALDRLDRQWRLGLLAEQEGWEHADRVEQAVSVLDDRARMLEGGTPATVAALQSAIRELLGRPELPVLPLVDRGLLPEWRRTAAGRLDRDWLEVVAAVRPRVAPLEAHQLTAADPWPAAIEAAGDDPWATTGPVRVAYGPGLGSVVGPVAVAVLDSWVDSVPSARHVTYAAFGFNAPKTRAPQAVLLAVPPDRDAPLDDDGLLDVVLGVRELAAARAARPSDRDGLPWATPSPVVQLEEPVHFLNGWP